MANPPSEPYRQTSGGRRYCCTSLSWPMSSIITSRNSSWRWFKSLESSSSVKNRDSTRWTAIPLRVASVARPFRPRMCLMRRGGTARRLHDLPIGADSAAINCPTIRNDHDQQYLKKKAPENVHQRNILIKQCNQCNFREKIPRAEAIQSRKVTRVRERALQTW